MAAAGKKSKKKKRKSEGALPEDGQAAPSPADDPLYVEHHWRLRLKVGMHVLKLPACLPGGRGSWCAGRLSAGSQKVAGRARGTLRREAGCSRVLASSLP